LLGFLQVPSQFAHKRRCERYALRAIIWGAWDPITEGPTAALKAFSGVYVTSVREGKNIPRYDFEIHPNPFNPNATIEYTIPESSHTSVVIYDVLGREVIALVDGFKNAGNYRINWAANNVFSGVYFCTTKSGSFLETKKIELLKEKSDLVHL